MKRTLTAFAAATILFASSAANAMCPDITGAWVAEFDTVISGDTFGGVYILNVTDTKINVSGYETFFGVREFVQLSGPYSVNNSCKVTFRPAGADNARWDGYIVNGSKMLFIGTNSEFGFSYQASVERMETL